MNGSWRRYLDSGSKEYLNASNTHYLTKPRSEYIQEGTFEPGMVVKCRLSTSALVDNPIKSRKVARWEQISGKDADGSYLVRIQFERKDTFGLVFACSSEEHLNPCVVKRVLTKDRWAAMITKGKGL
jgi:hypothetical protein